MAFISMLDTSYWAAKPLVRRGAENLFSWGASMTFFDVLPFGTTSSATTDSTTGSTDCTDCTDFTNSKVSS